MVYFSLLFSIGCSFTPTEVDKAAIERAVAARDTPTICVGLKMPDPELKKLATEELRRMKQDASNKCICDHLVNESKELDEDIANALKGENSDAIAKCFSTAVQKPGLKNHAAAITAFSQLSSPMVNTTLSKIAHNELIAAEARASAIKLVGRSEEFVDLPLDLATDENPLVQAAAIEMLGFHKKVSRAKDLIERHVESEKAEVRAAALLANKQMLGAAADEMLCEAMMNDDSPIVRKAAILSYEDLERRDPIRCLRKRANTVEADSEVREALLRVLQTMGGDAKAGAFSILCDSIPFWLRNYVKDDVISKLKGVNIVKAQNNVDHKNSAKCFKRAYQKSSGYSCYAKMHIGLWFYEVSGNDGEIDLCPGLEEYKEEL